MLRLICSPIFMATVYVGSYMLLLQPDRFYPSVQMLDSGTLVWRVPKYRIGGDAAERVFRPLVRVDARVRPSYWQFVER